MLCLLSIIAILAILALGNQGAQAVSGCTKQFYTVNTFRAQKSVSISCLGLDSSCKVYYSPPGNGCNAGSLALIGIVAENDTQALPFNFELGGGFCSDTQFSVYAVDDADNIVAHLPRATEAGTKFNLPLYVMDSATHYQCIVSALDLPANLFFDDGDIVESLSVDRYNFNQTSFKIAPNTGRIVKFMSNNPVIVSCVEDSPDNTKSLSDRLVTLQPISSEPLLVSSSVGGSSIVLVMISNCSTNEQITNFSKVKVSIGNTHGMPCSSFVTRISRNGANEFYFAADCTVLVEPLEEVCLSVAMETKLTYLAAVGLPESKFSTRFPSSPSQSAAFAYSFSLSTCTRFINETDQENLDSEWEGGELADKVAEVDLHFYSRYAWVECEKPALVTTYHDSTIAPFLAGYQTMELWQPFLDSQCSGAPPSNARSRAMVWLAFFGCNIFIFSSS